MADDDKVIAPRSAFGRFYRFMSASSVKIETFPEGFDMRVFKRRRVLGLLALIVVVALVVWLFYCRIGLAILFAPLIVPMVALALSRLFALDVIPKRAMGNTGKVRLWTGRPALAFAIAYLIVYAAYLISTPFRPMPLDPPPPELMAKIHPCLLDENGEIRKPDTIIVDDFRTEEEGMYLITNNTPPQLKVLAAMLMDEPYAICDPEQKERRRLEDELVSRLGRSADTNMLSLANAGDMELMQAIRDDTANLIGIAEKAEQPQLGFAAIIPRYAESRREYVRFSTVFLPPLKRILTRTKACFQLAADKGEVSEFCKEIGVHASLCRAIDFHDNLIDELVLLLMDTYSLSGVMRMGELHELTDHDAEEVASALQSMVGEKHFYEDTLQSAERNCLLEVDPPWSGDSFIKAIKSVLMGNLNVFCYSRRSNRRITRDYVAYGALKTARWVPCLATWIGYDVNAQMETLKRVRAWNNVSFSTQLKHGDCIFEEWFPKAALAHPFARGGLVYAILVQLFYSSQPALSPFLVQACYTDCHDMVADVALRLSQFRGEKGHDAESLAEVREALGWKPREDSDLEVFYEPIPAPEGAAEGTFAYAIGLKPKVGCRKAFENTGAAWLVVRNPNFAGTLGRRFLSFEQYRGYRLRLSWKWHVVEEIKDAKETDEIDETDPFALPATLFGDDPAALEKAVKALRVHWRL